MLVLSRKPGEKLVIGDGITITILEVIGGRVRVGVEAPDDVRILRGELACWEEQPPVPSTPRTRARRPQRLAPRRECPVV